MVIGFVRLSSPWYVQGAPGIGFEQKEPTVIHEDNQSAMSLSRNPRDHNRTTHIDVKFHYTRKAIEENVIDVQYLCTAEMLQREIFLEKHR